MMGRRFLVLGLIGFFGFQLQVEAKWTQSCEAEAKRHLGHYLRNASVAQNSWPYLKGSSSAHMKTLGELRKIIRESGLLDKLKKGLEETSQGRAPNHKDSLKQLRAARIKALKKYRDVYDSDWSFYEKDEDRTDQEVGLRKKHNGTMLHLTLRFSILNDKVIIYAKTYIPNTFENVQKFGMFYNPPNYSFSSKGGRYFDSHAMVTSWKINLKGDIIETHLGGRWQSRNPYNGKFMSFQDYLIENELLPDECRKYFTGTGQKVTLRLSSNRASRYESSRSDLQRSWRIVFEDEEGNEIKAKSAR